MAEFLTTSIRQTNPLVSPDGYGGSLRLNRKNEIVTTDDILQYSLDGRLFCANAGTKTTPFTFPNAATATDVTKPAFYFSVPAGTTVIPVSLRSYMEAFGTTLQFEIFAAVGTGGSWGSGGTAVVPVNMRTDQPNTSACTCYCAANTTCVYPTVNVTEFWRDGQQFAVTKSAGSATVSVSDPNNYVWKMIDSFCAPVLVGPAQLFVVAGHQAATGFIQFIYVEMPSTTMV